MPLRTPEFLGIAPDKYYQGDRPFGRLLSEAPYFSRCSENKTAAFIKPREYALRYPYLQVNRPGRVSWLVFDLDHSHPFIWEDEHLPAPHFVVSNRQNGHSHLFYAIVPVCTSEKARSRPIRYMKAVYEALAARLNADSAYRGPVAKTPGHPWWWTWEIHSKEYELGELAEYVSLPLKPFWGGRPDMESVSHSRHCVLFEKLRHHAYSVVRRAREEGTYGSFYRHLEGYALERNNYRERGFALNLRFSQVRATVKSVARWTWERYTGSGRCHRGVMSLDPRLSLHERQRLSAERTHRLRHERTEAKTKVACRSLHGQGESTLTQKAIAHVAGLTRQTVANYAHLLKEFLSHLYSPFNSSKPNVNYGAHQISTGGGYRVNGVPSLSFLNDVVSLDEIEGMDTS